MSDNDAAHDHAAQNHAAQNHAAQLDGDVLGERVGDDGLPGVGDFPPDQMLGVNDPNQVAPDDVAMREARTRGEETPSSAARSGDLLPPEGDDDRHDDVQQMLASTGDPDGSSADAPAEIDAIHVTRES
jgi:hypothetical protein